MFHHRYYILGVYSIYGFTKFLCLENLELYGIINSDLELTASWIRLRVNQMALSTKAATSQSEGIGVQLKGTTTESNCKATSIKYLPLITVTVISAGAWKSNLHRKQQPLLQAYVLLHMDYCSVAWHSCNSKLSQALHKKK